MADGSERDHTVFTYAAVRGEKDLPSAVTNSAGVYEAKMVVQYKKDADHTLKMIWIVQGKADILSNEHNDIPLVPNQTVKGFSVTYASTNGVYGLIFDNSVSPWNRVVVDYPAMKTVELGGVTYKISINNKGILSLA